MSIVDRFGAKVGETAEKDPVRAVCGKGCHE